MRTNDFASQCGGIVVGFADSNHHRPMPRQSFTAPAPEALGKLLPTYDFECLIAKGGMGAVYRAKQRSLARAVAIKILPQEFGKDPQFRESFETEARAMARLNHPNLIGVYDYGAVDEMLYIVMEYVPGKSLYHSSYGKQVDPLQAAELVQGICAGLGHAHENGIVHRDIKPSNVLLTPKAEPKIGDFGLAHPVESTGSGLVMGTPGYTAPEVLSNPHVADRRSDLFAVGVILYELVTGQRQEAGAPPPSTLCRCGPGIDEIWRRATNPNPALRYPDAKAFHAALGEWMVKFKKSGGKVAMLSLPATKGSPIAGSPPAAAATAGGDNAETPAVVIPKIEYEVKTNWHFIRNLFIIAALIVIIAVVWKQLEVARAARELANRQLLEEDALKKAKAAAEAKEQSRQLANQGTKPTPPGLPADPVTPPQPPPPPKEVPKPETPLESLDRLRFDLVAGKRTEMPLGVIRRGESDFMVVPTPMTWADAAWFAERFGGHLPIPTSTDDIGWFGQRAPGEDFVWLGGGRGGRNDWTFLDGTVWRMAPLPKGTGTHVGVNKLGLVRALDSKAAQPFLIQWHRDGSNPASLAAALQAVRETLDETNPVFPPGTEAFDSRHYLYVARPIQWRDAVDMAERSGGHLAVASDAVEAGQLAQFADGVTAPDGVWLGAFLKGRDWLWITGEPWTTAKWATGTAPTEGALALIARPQKGWDSQDLSMLASGFIIEWSQDRHRRPGSTAATPDTGSGGALTVRAKELVIAADKKRAEQMTANARTFTWDLDLWLRGLSTTEQTNWQLQVARLKAAVKNSRVPAEVPKESGISLSPPMAKIVTRTAEKQEQINAAFLAEVNKLRVAYLVKVKAAALAADGTGDTALAGALRADFTKAADTETWVRSFGIEPATNAPVLKPAETPGGPGR